MHSHIINASLQVIPISDPQTSKTHPYEQVDEAISVIQQSGLKFEVGPFATTLEGTYAEVFAVVDKVNEQLLSNGCPEWIVSLQIQIKNNQSITMHEKVSKFR